MKEYLEVKSTVMPKNVLTDEYSVWIYTNIQSVIEYNDENEITFEGFKYDMIQYDKNEYIEFLSKSNSDLSGELIKIKDDNIITLEACAELYEMFLV